MSATKWASVAIAFLLTGAPASTFAQDVPVVFIHGVRSNGATWNTPAGAVQSSLQVQSYLAELDWERWYEEQADTLHAAAYWLPNSTITIGHSNGGIVARQWNKFHDFRGIVTMGTPHEGSLLIFRALDIAGFNYDLFNAANFLIAVLGPNGQGNEFSWLWPLLSGHLNFAQLYANTNALELAFTLGVIGNAPVLGQMVPGSPPI